MACQALVFQHRFNVCQTIGTVRPYARSRMIPIKDRFNDLAVMDRCCGHVITPHQFMTAVRVDVVFVTIVALAMFLVHRASISFWRLLADRHDPSSGVSPALFIVFFFSAVMLPRDRHNGSVNDLVPHGQVTLVFQIAIEVREQPVNHVGISKSIPVQPYCLGVGNYSLNP